MGSNSPRQDSVLGKQAGDAVDDWVHHATLAAQQTLFAFGQGGKRIDWAAQDGQEFGIGVKHDVNI